MKIGIMFKIFFNCFYLGGDDFFFFFLGKEEKIKFFIYLFNFYVSNLGGELVCMFIFAVAYLLSW